MRTQNLPPGMTAWSRGQIIKTSAFAGELIRAAKTGVTARAAAVETARNICLSMVSILSVSRWQTPTWKIILVWAHIGFNYILHAGHELFIHLCDAPLLLLPALKFIFLTNMRRVQGSCPSGAFEQARAVIIAACLASSLGLEPWRESS